MDLAAMLRRWWWKVWWLRRRDMAPVVITRGTAALAMDMAAVADTITVMESSSVGSLGSMESLESMEALAACTEANSRSGSDLPKLATFHGGRYRLYYNKIYFLNYNICSNNFYE